LKTIHLWEAWGVITGFSLFVKNHALTFFLINKKMGVLNN